MGILVGLAGFIAGFFSGQMLLMFLLRHKSNKDLKTEKKTLKIYSMLNWAMALLGTAAFLFLYRKYF